MSLLMDVTPLANGYEPARQFMCVRPAGELLDAPTPDRRARAHVLQAGEQPADARVGLAFDALGGIER